MGHLSNNYRIAKNFGKVFTPHACTRGKAIGFVCHLYICLFVVVVVTKIARSRVLRFCVCCNYHELVDTGEKLVSVWFVLLNMAH